MIRTPHLPTGTYPLMLTPQTELIRPVGVEACHSDCSDDEALLPPGRSPPSSRAPLPQYGRYRGMLLRSQLVELLKYKVYDGRTVLYNDDYPRYPSHTVSNSAVISVMSDRGDAYTDLWWDETSG